MDDIREVIMKAGKKLKESYFESFSYTEKEKYDLVSEVDLKIEDMLVSDLKAIYPDTSLYSEECGEIEGKQGTRWIIDPIDGTANFIFGVPYFNISVCLEKNGQIVEAYVYNPITDEMYYSAEDEKASFLNGKPIHVSGTYNIRDSLIAFGFSANIANINRYHRDWPALFSDCKKGMGLLSPALNICNVARGRTDCFIDFGSSMEGHAGAALILENAGGAIANYDLSKWDYKTKGCAAVNNKLFNVIRGI